MTRISTFALVFTLSAASIHAEESRQLTVRMTFSGSGTYLARAVNLIPNMPSVANGPVDDLIAAGDGSLGPFTLHDVSATTANPTGFGCAGPNSIAFTFVAAGGVYRFEDGSLLTTRLKAGTVCINLTAGSAADNVTEEITGGTGRFKNASGTLTTTTTSDHPVLFDASMQPVLVAIPSAVVTGTIVLPNPE
jgi:hypothetical protein